MDRAKVKEKEEIIYANSLSEKDRYSRNYICPSCGKIVILALPKEKKNYFKHHDGSPGCDLYIPGCSGNNSYVNSFNPLNKNKYHSRELDFFSKNSKFVHLGQNQSQSMKSYERYLLYSKIREELEINETDKNMYTEKYNFWIRAPYIKLKDDEIPSIYLVIPEQSYLIRIREKEFIEDKINQKIEKYEIIINKSIINTKINYKLSQLEKFICIRVSKIEILLDNPLISIEIVYPRFLTGRKYIYSHEKLNYYAFFDEGKNKGRMFFLKDKHENVLPIPQKKMIILVHYLFKLEKKEIFSANAYIWDMFKAYYINFNNIFQRVLFESNKSVLILRNKSRFFLKNEDKKSSIKDNLIDIPFFNSANLKLCVDSFGNEQYLVFMGLIKGGLKRVKRIWRSCDELDIKEFIEKKPGMYQIQIYLINGKNIESTLFFRYYPNIEIIIPKLISLIHNKEYLEINLKSRFPLPKIVTEDAIFLKKTNNEGNYNLKIGIKHDQILFHIESLKYLSSIPILCRFPVLKWKLSTHQVWKTKFFRIPVNILVSGKPIVLEVHNNIKKYNIKKSILLFHKQEIIQQENFDNFSIELNIIFDSIRNSKDNYNLFLEFDDLNLKKKRIKLITFIQPKKKRITRKEIQEEKEKERVNYKDLIKKSIDPDEYTKIRNQIEEKTFQFDDLIDNANNNIINYVTDEYWYVFNGYSFFQENNSIERDRLSIHNKKDFLKKNFLKLKEEEQTKFVLNYFVKLKSDYFSRGFIRKLMKEQGAGMVDDYVVDQLIVILGKYAHSMIQKYVKEGIFTIGEKFKRIYTTYNDNVNFKVKNEFIPILTEIENERILQREYHEKINKEYYKKFKETNNMKYHKIHITCLLRLDVLDSNFITSSSSTLLNEIESKRFKRLKSLVRTYHQLINKENKKPLSHSYKKANFPPIQFSLTTILKKNSNNLLLKNEICVLFAIAKNYDTRRKIISFLKENKVQIQFHEFNEIISNLLSLKQIKISKTEENNIYYFIQKNGYEFIIR